MYFVNSATRNHFGKHLVFLALLFQFLPSSKVLLFRTAKPFRSRGPSENVRPRQNSAKVRQFKALVYIYFTFPG